MTGGLRVLRPGVQCLVQDLGRPGLAAVGVGRSGAADRGALVTANRLVGNADGAAALEIVLGGTVLEAQQDVVVALAGAPAVLLLEGSATASRTAVEVPAGSRLRVTTAARGLRSYLAVRGGIDVPRVLGSAATDTLSGLGPPPVTAGTLLAIGEPTGALPADAGEPAVSGELTDGPTVLALLPGPRADWFADLAQLAGDEIRWQVSPASNRIGIRLTGTPLQRTRDRRDAELPSEGMVRGSVQVPPDGLPVVLGADHPVTGGYPVIGVLTEHSADLAAQLRPGAAVRFHLLAGH